jgi:putative PIG3 family NAD(P)H quinone oxidoreductase
MRAVVSSEGAVTVVERPDPEPGAGELLVAVRAAGLNNADTLQARGRYPAPPGSSPDILGLELAGEVIGVGPQVARFHVGDRVMAVMGGGAQAERAVVHERLAMPVPDGLSWESAGAFPEVFSTAHDALFTQGQLAMGERLLVHGAAGGVGTAAVQLGAAAGARVTATVRNPEHRQPVADLGAEAVAPEDFAARGPFDVILELVGGPNLADNLSALGVGGRISVIGTGAGATAELNLGQLMGKRARLSGSTLRARPLEAKADVARRVEAQVLPLLAAGKVRVLICDRYPLSEAPAAYQRFAAGRKLGKIVLTPG